MGLVLVWSRFANLGTSFWSDEAYSAYYYSNRGPHGIWFGTYVPNNHVLYNLLSWVTQAGIGRFEASYRIWSVVPGAAAVVLCAWWVWKRFGPIAATALVVLATVSPVHLVLTPQARGYGLAMFAGVVMLVGAARASDSGETRDIVLFAIGAVIGIWTLPVFAVAAIGQSFVLLWNKTIRKRTFIACIVIAALAILCYAPLFGGILDNADQQFGTRLAVVETVTGVYHHLAAPTLSNAMPFALHSTFNEVATFFVFALLTIAAITRLWRRGDRALLANLLVPIFFTYLVLVVGRFYVQPRFASYLLFHVLVVLAIGVQQLWEVIARVTALKAVAAVVIVAFALTGSARVASLTEAQAKLPWENGKFVAQVAKATGMNYVFTDSTHPGALYFYMGADHVVAMHATAVQKRSFCAVQSRFIFVDDEYHQIVTPHLKCLTDRHALKITVPQQLDPPIRRPGAVTMYIVPATRKFQAKQKAKAKRKAAAQNKPATTSTTKPG